jgi:hypothetical protein
MTHSVEGYKGSPAQLVKIARQAIDRFLDGLFT